MIDGDQHDRDQELVEIYQRSWSEVNRRLPEVLGPGRVEDVRTLMMLTLRRIMYEVERRKRAKSQAV